MKFRFCGELDAPDWLLKEITVLSKISAVRMRLVVQQIITSITDENIDYEKVIKLTKDSNLDFSDIKGVLSCLRYVICQSIKYKVDETTLSNELQQLGLPKEHCDTLSKLYRDNSEKLQTVLAKKTLKVSQLGDVSYRIDYWLCSNDINEINTPSVHLNMNFVNEDNERSFIAFETSVEKLRVLYNELKSVQSIIDAL